MYKIVLIILRKTSIMNPSTIQHTRQRRLKHVNREERESITQDQLTNPEGIRRNIWLTIIRPPLYGVLRAPYYYVPAGNLFLQSILLLLVCYYLFLVWSTVQVKSMISSFGYLQSNPTT